MTSPHLEQHVKSISDLLVRAEQPVRTLRLVSWEPKVKTHFFSKGGRELPVPTYPAFDPNPSLEILKTVRSRLGESEVDQWFERIAVAIEGSCRMLAARGTAEFYRWSAELYGTPNAKLPDETNNAIGLAQQFTKTFDQLTHIDLGAPPPACLLASTVRDKISRAATALFHDAAPKVEIVAHMSANAIAGPRTIRIRRGAHFSERDVEQLIQHEAYIHVATFLNGFEQKHIPVLSRSHAGTTKTQEGLAIFAEFITGSLDTSRLRRLTDRILAVQMAIDGADFLEVYKFFVDRCGNEDQSFEDTRRVFRGGVVTGGAPYTKDIVYLDGLLRVHNFLRIAVGENRADCLRMLFCGKLDIEDIPVLCQLADEGLCTMPRFLPPWVSDLRFLVSYLAYSLFLNKIDLAKVRDHYVNMLARAPRIGSDAR